MINPLAQVLSERSKTSVKGVFCNCTANPLVIKACMRRMLDTQSPLIIEATANQVNQDGGYTGMTPVDYREFVLQLAHETGFPLNRLILGGDHLGPLTWMDLPNEVAMEKAEILVDLYASAGYSKIHLDTSMRLSEDDPNLILSTATIAERGVRLLKIAEAGFKKYAKDHPHAVHPVYIIGSEVPIPGGAQEEEGISVTKPEDFSTTVNIYRQEIEKAGLTAVWDRIVAVVVQPGVEFGDETVHEYDQEAAQALIHALHKQDGFVFEGHSTDYQTKKHLAEMVDDGIAILKVGPALTFALRQGLFALAMMENEMISDFSLLSHYIEILDKVMLEQPKNWQHHYHGTSAELAFARKYSFSDRSRYYLPHADVEDARQRLFANTREIPLSLLSQFMPIQYRKVREGSLESNPEALVLDWVCETIDDYLYACER